MKDRQTNFELLKIVAMLAIVAHHLVAKNIYNVDVEVVGITFNKIFLQFIGNFAFVGNNLFFMASAWFLCESDGRFDLKKLVAKWRGLELQMLFYSIGLYIFFAIWKGNSYGLLFSSLFPTSTSIWWYPTTYIVFLFIWPFYQKYLMGITREDLKKYILVMLCIFSLTTLIPFFSYGSTNLVAFLILYAIVYYIKKYPTKFSNDKKWYFVGMIGGCLAALASIIVMDMLGEKILVARQYSCYYIRGNYRLLPMVISISAFIWCTKWKINSRFINLIARSTFGVYLIHMYPKMQELLFENIFDLSMYIDNKWLPINLICIVLAIFVSCCIVDEIRRLIFRLIIAPLENFIVKTRN